MKFGPVFITDRTGQTIELRNAELSDSKVLIDYLKTTAGETPFLMRDPEEVDLSVEQEEAFLRNVLESERELLLIALADGRHIGNCSVLRLGNYKRYRHRCSIAIALYKEYCGRGIGRAMLVTALERLRGGKGNGMYIAVLSAGMESTSAFWPSKC